MWVIPGTDRGEMQEMKKRTEVENVLASGIDEEMVDESRAVDCMLKAGGVSVHHPNLIHGSNANNSPRRRCGLTIRYIPTTTRIKLEKRWDLTPEGRIPSAFLLRGEAVPGINGYNPWPKYLESECMRFRGCEEWT